MTINLITTQHSVHHGQVEWDVLSGIISQFAYFEFNKSSLTSELFVNRIDDLMTEFVRIQSYEKEFKEDYHQILNQLFAKLPSDQTLSKFIGHVSKQGVLNFQELNKLALLIECGQFIKQDFPNLKLPEFSNILEIDFQPISRKFLREFRHLVDDSGEVHFDRHPELSDLTRRLRELEDRIRKSVQEWINEPQNQKTLQYNSYDVHYDRYVVPIRSDSYRSDIGLIVSRSESALSCR